MGELKDWMIRVCNRVWREEKWIEDWCDGIIAPIIKKGEGIKVEEYRGATLDVIQSVYVGVSKKIR